MNDPLPFRADPAQPAPPAARGRRPEFTDDPMLDRLYSVTLALVAELAVTRARLDTVERLLDAQGSVTRAAIEDYQPTPEVEAERNAWREAYLKRVLRMHTPES